MTLYVKRTLEDGSTVISQNDDAGDREVAILRPGQWEEIAILPHDRQHDRLDQLIASNQADKIGRSALDEQTMDTARDASSGEAHQDQERASGA